MNSENKLKLKFKIIYSNFKYYLTEYNALLANHFKITFLKWESGIFLGLGRLIHEINLNSNFVKYYMP